MRIVWVFILSFLFLHAELRTIDATMVEKMAKQGVPVIDIRLPIEWKTTGVIKGAHLMTFFDERGGANAPEWMYRLGTLVDSKDRPFIIYCAHANRTQILGEWLSKEMGFKKVYQLKGGIENGWIALKKPTTPPTLNKEQ